jgi:uncharacterized surface protein with fasciclin (FAS1) repeats
MINLKNKFRSAVLPVLTAGVLFASCNKDVKQFDAITQPDFPSGSRLATTIAANPNDSLYYRMIVRAGMVNTLNDSTRKYTMFITDNNGMKLFINQLSGGLVPLTAPDAAFSAFITTSLPATSAAGIVQYNTVGEPFMSSSFNAFPNTPLGSQYVLDANNPFLRMMIFPVKTSTNSYVNTMPITGVDQLATNGVIHHTFSLVAPPTALLKPMIAAESTLSYFRAAVARADSGQVGTNKFDSLMNYGLVNMTVLAPNDAAFQTFIFGLVYTKTLAATGSTTIATATANGAVAAGPAFLGTNNVTTADVRGIMAYHLLASKNIAGAYQPNLRVFAEDVPPATATPFFVKTLVNSSLATHPGIIVSATYSGPTVTALTFTGVGPLLTPTTPPFTGGAATAVSRDKLGVNGIYHIIDKVLLPQ